MITRFHPSQQHELTILILDIQSGELSLGLKDDEQPDLLDTKGFYKDGGFWVAQLEGELIGCIGLQRLNSDCGILRKLFLKRACREHDRGIACQLLRTLLVEAKDIGLSRIFLDTPAVAKASHSCYRKNDFIEINPKGIPPEYNYVDRDSLFFVPELPAKRP